MKQAAILIAVCVFLSSKTLVLAHSGRTNSSGCHNCYTGSCAGTYHCHNSGSAIQNDSLQYRKKEPVCPKFSIYNSYSQECECLSGYVSDGVSCLEGNDFCIDKFGYHSHYEEFQETCVCDTGYTFSESGNYCVSLNDICKKRYGVNAEFDHLYEKCDCKQGYELVDGVCEIKIVEVKTELNTGWEDENEETVNNSENTEQSSDLEPFFGLAGVIGLALLLNSKGKKKSADVEKIE